MEYWMNCQHVGLYEVYFNTLIWTWMWASVNLGSHDGNKYALVIVNFRKRAEQGTMPRAVVPFLVGEPHPCIPVILNQRQLCKQWRQQYIDFMMRVKQRQSGSHNDSRIWAWSNWVKFFNRRNPDDKKTWSWTKQATSGNQESSAGNNISIKPWRQQNMQQGKRQQQQHTDLWTWIFSIEQNKE